MAPAGRRSLTSHNQFVDQLACGIMDAAFAGLLPQHPTSVPCLHYVSGLTPSTQSNLQRSLTAQPRKWRHQQPQPLVAARPMLPPPAQLRLHSQQHLRLRGVSDTSSQRLLCSCYVCRHCRLRGGLRAAARRHTRQPPQPAWQPACRCRRCPLPLHFVFPLPVPCPPVRQHARRHTGACEGLEHQVASGGPPLPRKHGATDLRRMHTWAEVSRRSPAV